MSEDEEGMAPCDFRTLVRETMHVIQYPKTKEEREFSEFANGKEMDKLVKDIQRLLGKETPDLEGQ